MAEITTERLLLRPIIEADARDVFEYSSSPHVGPNAGWKPHESEEESLEIMKQIFIDQESIWGIVLQETSKLIGSIGLVADAKRENKHARMLGYAIGQPYWGQGFATEAAKAVLQYGFEELELHLVTAYCYPFNARSRNVLEKCGMQYEGTLRMAEKIFDGNIYDNACFSISAPEYAGKYARSRTV